MNTARAAIHPDLLLAQQIAYMPNGLIDDTVIPDQESQEYGACSFNLSNKIIKFRVAKITPTKIGQFVTLWKRIGNGPIMPYDISDSIDLFIVSVRNNDHVGQFIFPSEILAEKGYVSQNGIGGKRAMRVYPPWDKTDSPQAKKTQEWQLIYFIGIHPLWDSSKLKKIFSL